jgi:hypothetical protein
LLICSNRAIELHETYFDDNFNFIEVTEGGHSVDKNLKCPKNFKLMKEKAKVLAKGFPFMRVDFYEVKDKLYFGELTFYSASGFERFEPKNFNDYLGSLINLKYCNNKEKK